MRTTFKLKVTDGENHSVILLHSGALFGFVSKSQRVNAKSQDLHHVDSFY